MNKHLNKLNLEVTELETQVGDSPKGREGGQALLNSYHSKCPIPALPGGLSTLTLKLFQEGGGSIPVWTLSDFILKSCKNIIMNI